MNGASALHGQATVRGWWVAITVPGIMRGFDAMHVGDNYLLVGADAS